jgi:succinyl-CoA synthetase beta subunit
MMSDSEFDSDGGLGPERKGPAVEATVPPTAGEVLAQECARAICHGEPVTVIRVNYVGAITRVDMSESEVAERLKHILDAKGQARRE